MTLHIHVCESAKCYFYFFQRKAYSIFCQKGEVVGGGGGVVPLQKSYVPFILTASQNCNRLVLREGGAYSQHCVDEGDLHFKSSVRVK